MGRKPKYSVEEKLNAVREYLDGNESMNSIAKHLNISFQSFKQWVTNYEAMGTDAFATSQNKHYSKVEKEQAVAAYLAGEGSLMDICKRFKILSTRQLRSWIKKYNDHEELNASGTGGKVIMTKGRKTTFQERVEIASYCISHGHNYAETAEGQLKDLCLKIDESKEQVVLKQKRLSVLKGMINCPSCGAEISSGSVFCNVCGNRVQAIQAETKAENVCPKCGAPIEDGFAFCTSCGEKIVEKTQQESIEAVLGEAIKETEPINICPNCGKVINPENAFCTGCGMKIETMNQAGESEPVIIEANTAEKRCPQCNALIEEEQKFCISCGMNLEQLNDINNKDMPSKNVCPNCGKEITDGDVFCINCGTKIKE